MFRCITLLENVGSAHDRPQMIIKQFGFVCCWVLIFALSPCYVLINAQVTHSRITTPVLLRIKSHE